ncbi:MAG: hypothetical protein ACJ798_17250 [Phenylobacterium sp.]
MTPTAASLPVAQGRLAFPPIASTSDYRIGYNILARRAGLRLTWIPKNMCSTLKLSFAVAEGIITAEDAPNFQNDLGQIHNWTWPLEARQALELAAQTSVAVVREPAGRLRSTMLEKAVYQTQEEFDRIVLPILNNVAGFKGGSLPDMTFGDLLDGLEWFPDRALDHHFVSQAAFLGGAYDRLLRFEDRAATASFFESHGIALYTIDAHATSRFSGELRTVSMQDPILAVREAFAAEPGVGRVFDGEIEAGIARTVAARYAADLELWSFAG